MHRLNIALFGAPRIECDGRTLEVDTRKAIALLSYLAVSGERHQRDTLATLFWPESDQRHARAALRRTLSTLVAAVSRRWLLVTREDVTLSVDDDVWVDVLEFRRRAADVRSTRPGAYHDATVQHELAAAAALYRGDFLAGFSLRDSPAFDDWQRAQAEDLRRQLARLLESLVTIQSQQGEFELALDPARRWLALDLLNEGAHRQLMLIYAWSGERHAALRQYRECTRILEQELGVAPLESTTRLYQEILRHQSPPSPFPTATQQIISALPTVSPAVNKPEDYPFVNRHCELACITGIASSLTSDGNLVVLTGETGSGKTRLATAAIDHLHAQGARVIVARCYEGEAQLTYGVMADLLRQALNLARRSGAITQMPISVLSEVSRLVPAGEPLPEDHPPPPPLDSPGAQARFLGAVFQVLRGALNGAAPGVMFVDDLHWIDSGSLDLLGYMARRLTGNPLLIVTAWRTEHMPADHRAHRIVADAQRVGTATIVPVAGLDDTAVRDLVESVAIRLDADIDFLSERLLRESEGLPFLLVEYLTQIQENPKLLERDAVWSIPRSVRELTRARLTKATQTELQVLATAAVTGKPVDFDTVRAVSGRNEDEVVAALEALVSRGILVEVEFREELHQSDVHYSFGHEWIREVLYHDTSPVRRRLLHKRVANSMRDRARSGDQESLAAQIALHYHRAGQDRDASEFYQRAGDSARKLYAHADALSHYRAALALDHPRPASLYESIGDVQMLTGNFDGALAAFETAASLTNGFATAVIEHKLGNVHQRVGQWDLAIHQFASADDAMIQVSTFDRTVLSARARLYADWSLTVHLSGDSEGALELGWCALDLAERGDDQQALAQAHNLLGILARRTGDLSVARRHLTASLELADAVGNPGARAAALNNLALAYVDAGDSIAAIGLELEALRLCITTGDRHREAALHSNLADALHTLGRRDETLDHLAQSAAIFAEIGLVAGEMQSEVWKLIEW